MNLKPSLRTLLVGAALVAVSLCAVPTPARAQVVPPGSVALPTDETLGQYINTAQLFQLLIDYHWLPNDVDANLRMGYVFGTVEFVADTTGAPGYDGPYEPPFYDGIPFTQANEAQYLRLAAGYYDSALLFESVGLAQGAAELGYDSGFYRAIADRIELDTPPGL